MVLIHRQSLQVVPFLTFDRFLDEGFLAINLVLLLEITQLDNIFSKASPVSNHQEGICNSFAENVQSAGQITIERLYLCLENAKVVFSYPGSSVFSSPRCLCTFI